MTAAAARRDFAGAMARLGPFGPDPLLAVGVSGGPHSLALTLLAEDWLRPRGGRLLALIADHGLRAESAAEAEGVAALLAARGIATRILPLGLAPGTALHDRARAARLAALLGAAEAAGAPWLLLGHHRGDQAETLAFRALRGSGPDGLAGMAAARAAPEALLLRPLLGMAPAALEAVCAEAGLLPVRDASNANPRFLRGRLRQVLDPDGPGAEALAEAAAAWGLRRDRARAAIATRLAEAAAFRPEGWARLDRAALGRDGIAISALTAALRMVSGGTYPAPSAGIAALLARGHGALGGAILTPSGVLAREPAALSPPVAASLGTVWDGRWRVTHPLPEGARIGPAGAGPAAKGWPEGLPAVVRAGLPCIFQGGESSSAVAHTIFQPQGGAAS